MNKKVDFKLLGSNLKKIREFENMTQSDVARFLGIDQSMVSKYESGERIISSDSLEKLARLFCCPVKDLLTSNDVSPKGKLAFRTDGLTFEDNCILADINAIILNQIEMDEVLYGKN
ncbi:helix-turn-helix domain-containing protein [Eubacterium oxidoreducens]|uniref:Transcriptional regulator, contains XRE-family HTH domain n=1 Tax=Eubacterium oxidoreducens TaxID=1732 RepID=A0A1G6C3L2_EUBOX|nr:helix-turn-helix transcriptional regulator [Eubacterium oxidoreducens]SDB27424.1 Transcriptional regulator, contains XRE-family HTH domain [Eubacterium oxidoreducens]